MRLADEIVNGTTVSDGWLRTVEAVNATSDQQVFHLVTRMNHPTIETPNIRAAADWLAHEVGNPLVETVANTIFPTHMAATSRDHLHLARRYRDIYGVVKRIDKHNQRGTYFGRLVSYPSLHGPYDQLSALITKLKVELTTRGPKSARYEISTFDNGSDSTGLAPPERESEDPPGLTQVYSAGQDNSPMGFPCLSFCSFQLDRRVLHMVAHYRRQHLIERGYGNYLGLGRLLRYVCDAAELHAGQLMVVVGAAAVDAPRYRIAQLLKRTS